MGTGYTRNDTANNIADGNIINAADFDGEYDAIEAAFNASTGHTHDGTSAEGAPIEVVGPSQDVVITASAIRPKTTNTVDLGTSSLEFKDAYFDGTVTADSVNITSGLTIDTINLTSTDAGAAKGPQLDIFRDSASPADSDVLGHIDFSGKDDGDNKTIYASILAEAADVTDTTEDGVMKFNTMVDGTDTTVMTITESNVGIGTSSPQARIDSSAVSNFSVTYNNFTGDGLHIQSTGTAGNGAYAGGISFSRISADNNSRAAGIAAVQTDSDADRIGLAFFTHPDTITSNDLAEAMRIASDGSVGIGTTSPSTSLTVVKTGAGVQNTLELRNSQTIAAGVGSSISFADSTGARNSYIGGAFEGSTNDDGYLSFVTRSSDLFGERMRIDSSGNVGIGTSSPSFSIGAGLHIDSGGYTAINLQKGTSGGGGHIIDFTDASNTIQYRIGTNFSSGGENLLFAYGSTPTVGMTLNSSGNVGIGTTSPAYNFQLSNTSGDANLGITASTTGLSQVLFTDGAVTGKVAYRHSTDAMEFTTNASEAMRIDSSGNVLVGTTSTDPRNFSSGTYGIRLFSSQPEFGVDTMYINRSTGTDGNIISFRKDSATVGTIGTNSSRLTIGNGDTGLLIAGDLDNITPFNTSTNASRDNAVDLGNSGVRFKDLYLSGGVYLGGTGSANLLYDYEESTWTPDLGSSISSLDEYGTYTKIGRNVFIEGTITVGTNSNGNHMKITNFPFTMVSGTGGRGGFAIRYSNYGDLFFLHMDSGNTTCGLYSKTGNILTYQQMSGKRVDFFGFYHEA